MWFTVVYKTSIKSKLQKKKLIGGWGDKTGLYCVAEMCKSLDWIDRYTNPLVKEVLYMYCIYAFSYLPGVGL